MVRRMLGNDGPKLAELAAGQRPRVILVSANDVPATLDRAKAFQREMFEAVGGNLEMKFAHYGPDNAEGVRRAKMTTTWVSDADAMGDYMGKVHCECGCYVSIRLMLAAAVNENKDRPVQAVVIVGDAFHDNPEDLDKAALYALELRNAGTKLFLFQDSDCPATALRLQRLAAVSGGVYFPRAKDVELIEALQAVTCFAAGGEEAVKAKGGKGATLLLEKLAQEPMPILEEREPVKVRTTQR
jgi:hypothetical protein